MSATIIDVARLCGYSKATVSRAYASPETVSEKTREKVYAAARALNYTPNAIARAMVRQQTENIAFVINEKQYPAILNPFYSPVLDAVIWETAQRNYSVFITAGHNLRLPNGEVGIKKQMDGVIFAGETDRAAIDAFRRGNIPVVLLNNEQDQEPLPCVVADHFQGAVDAVTHLCERGHRRIGLLAGRFSEQVSQARLKGYLHVLAEHALTVDPRLIWDLEPTLEDGEAVMAELLTLPEEIRPSAVFCTNDTIAVGAVKAALRAGLRVPEEMAVVGFDDNYISRIIEPELTTIRIDAAKMGRIAAQRLFDLIDQKPLEERVVRLPARLVIRGTT